MKKEYIKPQAMLVETLDSYCLGSQLKETSAYGDDHSVIVDSLYEEE